MKVLCNEEDNFVVDLNCTEIEYHKMESDEFTEKDLEPWCGHLFFASNVEPAGRRVVKMELDDWFEFHRPYVAYYAGRGAWPGNKNVA